MIPFLALEEHFVSPDVRDASAGLYSGLNLPAVVTNKLLTFGDERINDMAKGHVSVQVVSHAPTRGKEVLEICRKSNDQLHQGVSSNPKRFAGFALLPMLDPPAAAAELERCTKDLGFVGALINNHADGRYYDDDFFWPIFAKAAELDVPLYLHPGIPSDDELKRYEGNFPKGAAAAIGQFAWGWHADTAIHILRLLASGLFDRFPKLKIIIGHAGEMLPFMLDRIIHFSGALMAGPGNQTRIQRGFRTVWDENIWVSISGFFALAPFVSLKYTTKVDRILYGVDYPFGSNEAGARFMNELLEKGLITNEELEAIAYQNAESLLGIRVTV